MQSNRPSILCTGPIDESILRMQEYKAADIDVIPFTQINTTLTETIEKQVKEILSKTAIVVFTSGNAIKSVAGYLKDKQPDWTIYCIGNTTYDLAKKYFDAENIKQTAFNARTLAEMIIPEINKDEVIFFCGNLRRNDLTDTLRQKGIAVKEIIVYQTSLIPVTIEKEYDAILFFSPSAAESFFSKNTLSAKTVLFVIGNTTASSVKKYSNNKIIAGDEPDKNKLISKAILYVHENSIHH